MEDLIIRVLQGAATDREEERLRGWRAADPENERSYREMKEVWELAREIRPADPAEPPPRARTVIRASEDRRAARIRTGAPGRFTRPLRGKWIGAGALAAAVVALAFALGRSGVGLPQAPPMAGSTIVTGSGELTTVTLTDGSTMRLGPRSRLRVESMGRTRDIRLEAGRAFFAVDADSTRPFTVRTPDGEALVLGTRFEVRAEKGRFRVLVVEGSVSVSSHGRAVDLKDGQMSLASAGAAPSAQGVEDVLGELAWMGGTLVFHETSLGQVIGELERWYGVTITLEPASLLDATITATFVERPLEDVMDVICETIMARCRITGESVFVERIGSTRSRDGGK